MYEFIDGEYATLPAPVQFGARTAVLLSAARSDHLLGMDGNAVPVKERLLAAFVSFDQRFHQDYAVYLASIRP